VDRKLSRKLHSIPPNERIGWVEVVARRCQQWHSCSAPKCPLDPLYEERVSYPDDPLCRAYKTTRLKIVAECTEEGVDTVKYLVARGLTLPEENSRQLGERNRARFAAMTPEEQEEVRARLRTQHRSS
jgi:hypothetical protein